MTFRQILGAAVYDLVPFLVRTLCTTSNRRLPRWGWNRNRRDILAIGPTGEGFCCQWEYTRNLHVTNVFPSLGSRLVKRMLADWPIELRDAPNPGLANESPEVSFVIGHRGTARLPHLLLTLKSIAAQIGVTWECLVVEQSYEQQLAELLPSWVRCHFTKTPSAEYLYNRSWALNEGARLASGRIVILHDGDMLVPTEYAAEIRRQVDAGFDVVNLKRFIAFLDEASTKFLFEHGEISGSLRSEQTMTNATAGGSLGMVREVFFAVGAMDEDFVGWGGEDTEFWDRCQTLRVANHTYMPIVHLWHSSQPGKAAVNGLGLSTADHFMRRMQSSTATRIDELRQRVSCKYR